MVGMAEKQDERGRLNFVCNIIVSLRHATCSRIRFCRIMFSFTSI